MKVDTQLFDQKLSITDAELNKYKELTQQYETKLAQLNSEIREVKRKAISEAKSIVDQASSTIENAVREINHRRQIKK